MSPEENFQTAVLIGRFQPFHRGHEGLLRRALDVAAEVVVVLGSAGSARTPRNPFLASEREAMIRAVLTPHENARVRMVGQRDVWDTARWAREVRAQVEATPGTRLALVGYHKDDTSSYLDAFPGWAWIDAGRQGPLDATPLRAILYGDDPLPVALDRLAEALDPRVLEVVASWARTGHRQEMSEDSVAAEHYVRRWGPGPFVTVDALVVAAGHVLLIRRKARPGRGLWALPGGFLEAGEPLEVAARRELLEETGLDLRGTRSFREMVFSHPGRSQRARIVTHAFLFEPGFEILPEVVAADDAAEARWIPVESLEAMEGAFFEDHFHILSGFLPGLPG